MLFLGIISFVAAFAHPAIGGKCGYDIAGQTLEVRLREERARLAVAPDGRVTLNGDACDGGATTSTIERVLVFGSSGRERLIVDASRPFAPGFGTEPGSPELEIDVRLGGGRDALKLVTGAGDDGIARETNGFRITGDEDVDLFSAGAENLAVDTRAGNDRIRSVGGSSALTVDGGRGADTLIGGPKREALIGGGGRDLLRGGEGNDLLRGGGADDRIEGGRGADSVTFRGAPRGVDVNLSTGRARGWGRDRLASIERVLGSGHRDVLRGTRRDDTLEGGRAADRIAGAKGLDVIRGGRGSDRCLDARDTSFTSCESVWLRVKLGSAAGLQLFVPAAYSDLVGYHESKFASAVPIAHAGEMPSVVLPSRSRGTGPTTAADVSVSPGGPVTSPVTGRVVSVTPYYLYCRYPDTRVVIAPKGHRSLRVLVLHVRDVKVRKGDRVTRSETLIGVPRYLGFRSQIEDYGGESTHVHVEVERNRATPLPGCAA